MKFKFRKGQWVVVIDDEQEYPTFDAFAKAVKAKKWEDAITRNFILQRGTVGKIKAKKKHIMDYDDLLYLVDIGGKEIIMSEKGLKKSKPPSKIKQALFYD